MKLTIDDLIKKLTDRMRNHNLIRFHATPEVAPLIDARIDELKAIIDLIETNYLGDDNKDYIKVMKRSD